jgi:hypothetical protein
VVGDEKLKIAMRVEVVDIADPAAKNREIVMDWIKKNYDQFVLALLAVLLVAVSVLLFLKTQSFADAFSDAAAAPNKSQKSRNSTRPSLGRPHRNSIAQLFGLDQSFGPALHLGTYYLEDGKLAKVTEVDLCP